MRSNVLPDRIDASVVLALAWPVIVQMLAFNAMLVADAIFVGRLGTAQLAAVGLAGTAFFLLRAFPNGLTSGVRVATSQATGAGDHQAARSFAWQGVWLALAFGLASLLAVPFGPAVFRLMGAGPELVGFATDYFTVLVFSAPFSALNMSLSAWFQGRGDTRTPMVGSVAANVLNIVLDPLFIFGLGAVPAMGVAGAAVATALARMAHTVYLVWAARRELVGVAARVDTDQLREVWRLGMPIGMQWQLDVASYMVFAAVLTAVGEVHLAAHVVVVRIICISFLPGYGVGEACSVLVGQAVGAGRPDAAREAHRAATGLAVVLMVGCGLLFVAIPDTLLAVFGAEPAVEEIGRTLLYIAAAFQIFDAVATVACSALTGAGDTRFVMGASMVGAWLVKVPLGTVLALVVGLGAPGAWLGLTGEIVFFAIVCLARVRGSAWLGALAQDDPGLTAAPAK